MRRQLLLVLAVAAVAGAIGLAVAGLTLWAGGLAFVAVLLVAMRWFIDDEDLETTTFLGPDYVRDRFDRWFRPGGG